MKLLKKIIYFLTKWKIVNKYKNRIIPFGTTCFVLSEQEMEWAKKYSAEKYLFIPTSIGVAVYVYDKDDNKIEITDYNTW